MLKLRYVHRLATLFVAIFTLYLSFTGSLIQLVDLRSLFTHATPFDPNVMAMRESFDGPPNYQVIMPADHLASPLPPGADLGAMQTKSLASARASLGAKPLRYVELRMIHGRAVGQVEVGTTISRFDAVTGAPLSTFDEPKLNFAHPASDRNTVKELHRMTTFGDPALIINILVSIGLGTLIVTGVILYAKMLTARLKLGRKAWFWSGGGGWRMLHRGISVLSAIFLVVVSLSGAWLAVESLCLAVNRAVAIRSGAALRSASDASAPVQDAKLPGMLATTLAAYRQSHAQTGIRVVRLRWFAGMPQGAIVTDDQPARQIVYNASTGRQVSESEPGYPPQGFPFGWQAHQIAKSIHRGDFIGLPGRFMDLFAGLSMIYLSVSGMVVYGQMWAKRRSLGRQRLLWT